MKHEIFVTRPSMPPFEEYAAMLRPLWENHWLTNMGAYHAQLERELTDYLQVPWLSLFCNGHLALEGALQAAELSGEVITTPYTFASTVHAIVRQGLTPVLCDVKPEDGTLDETKPDHRKDIRHLAGACVWALLQCRGHRQNCRKIRPEGHL